MTVTVANVFLKNSYLSLSSRVLQSLQFCVRSVSDEGHFYGFI